MAETPWQGALDALSVSFFWAAVATLCIFPPGVALAYALARFEFVGKRALSAMSSLPLALPPTATGYLLLRLFADNGLLGRDGLGLDILFSGTAVAVACAVMGFPLFVRTARVSFENIDPRLEAMARTLGSGRLRVFLTVTAPLALKGLAAAAILAFIRGLGEFGATIVIAGGIPGRTQTIASAIHSAQQSGRSSEAALLTLIALAAAFAAVYAAETLSQPRRKEHA